MMGNGQMNTTPGIYYAIAYCLSCCLFIANGPKRFKRAATIGIQATFFMFLSGIMIASDGTVQLFIPCMLLYALMIVGNIFLSCKYDFKTALYFAGRAFITGEFIASLEWQIKYYLFNHMHIKYHYIFEIMIMVSVHCILFTILYVLEKRHSKENQVIRVNIRGLISLLIVCLATFVVSNLSYVIGDSLFSSQFVAETFMIRTLVDMGGVAILFAYHMQLGELEVRLEVDKLQDMLSMQYNNYMVLEKSIDVINQKYHDLKYQITVLREEADIDTNLTYLDAMEQDIKGYEAQNKTGNKVLDTILTGKSIQCQNQWIEFTSVVDGEAVAFMDAIDISTLFGNMLDNAIESVSKIEKKERRLIHLTVSKQKDFLRIREENCYQDEIIFENGTPRTTKSDKRYHGFGIKSIQNTVKKYGGSVTLQADKGWFELRILIPHAYE